MKYIFILNSFTLKTEVEKIKRRIEEYCTRENMEFIIEINSEEVSTESIVAKYRDQKNILLAVGGDGMVNRVLNGIAGTDNILGIIPLGSGNDFYKSVEKDLKEYYNTCDLIKINDRHFINVACFGIDADVANKKGEVTSKLIPKSQRYNASLLKTFSQYKCRNLEIEINGETLSGEYTTVAVCNGVYYGNGYKISPNSNPTNGLLDVYVVDKVNKLRMVNLILKMKEGNHLNEKEVHHYQTNKMIIKSPTSFVANIDGEELFDRRFEIEVLKNGIMLYYDKSLIDSITK
ncbi:MAG: diacylglycerol kinase family lipid kinase [Firmicutes bacterium]|nr:diacylglycerol kinase family lipid kinase [Bacillota bacterium]